MFERFTNRARRVIVLAQDEARDLQHNYIGTEHLLLGLLGMPDGIGGRALESRGMSLAAAREAVTAMVGRGTELPSGRIPFTPRAKKVLELSLREALALHHNYIGTEHLLLGLLREGDGVGAQILRDSAGDPAEIRTAVLDLLPSGETTQARRWLLRNPLNPSEEPEELRTTPAARTSLDEAARLAGLRPVGSHHLLLAALADPQTAAAQALTALGLDLDQAREALRNADVTGTSDEQPEERGRRHMLIRSAKDAVTIEATDTEIVNLARAAVEALGDQSDPPGTIRGDRPIATSFEKIWQALRDSLENIRNSAQGAASTAMDPPGKSPEEPGETAEAS
jgi:ATP-dependent Clp protease ATP-binding subunit ClpA